jgi:hypothetical protein
MMLNRAKGRRGWPEATRVVDDVSASFGAVLKPAGFDNSNGF